MDALLMNPALVNGVGVVAVVFIVGMLVFRGHLIPGKWHREALVNLQDQITKAEGRADRWEQVALKALNATERLTAPVEVSAKVLTRLPNPSQEGVDG